MERIKNLWNAMDNSENIIQNRISDHLFIDFFIIYDPMKEETKFLIDNIPKSNNSIQSEKKRYKNLIYEIQVQNDIISVEIVLTNNELIRIFAHMIVDLVNNSASKLPYLDICLTIIKQWSKFFESGRRLSNEKIKGLISELLFLKNLMETGYTSDYAIDSWDGPDDKSVDFNLDGDIGFEIKTANKNHVNISSEYQLSLIEYKEKYLCCYPLQTNSGENGYTINKLMDYFLLKLDNTNDYSVLDRKVTAYGFVKEFHEEIEGNQHFFFGDIVMYEINDNFPKLVSENIPSEIKNIKYQINLNDLDEKIIDHVKIINDKKR